jgi:hypothetical protein
MSALHTEQDTQCTYKRNIEGRSRNHCCRGKAISIRYSECVFVALVIHHAMRMRHIIFSYVACLAVYIFSTVPHKRHDFREKVIEHKICFDFLYNFSQKHFFILRRSERGVIINVHRSSSKVPVILVRILMKL